MESARFQSATRKAASVANYHHGTLEHDVPVTECDYWISGMRVVKPSRRKPPFPTVQQNTGDGNTQGSPLGRFAWPCIFPSLTFNSLLVGKLTSKITLLLTK